MAQSDALLSYKPGSYPTLAGGEQRFLTEELARLKRSIDLLITVVKEIDARLIAHSI